MAKSLFGKALKSYSESSWELVKGSVQKPNKALLKEIKEIRVHESDYDDGCYAVVLMTEGYTQWKLDRRCKLEEGDLIDPTTFMVFDMTNGEKTISRAAGKKL